VSAREEILGRIRSNLAVAHARHGRPELPAVSFPRFADGLETIARRVESFRARLESVGGECLVVPDEVRAGAAIAAWLRARGADHLALGDGALTRAVGRAAAAEAGLALLEPPVEREALLAAAAGLSGAVLGIAETGTLALASTDERSRLASLVPPLAISVLPVEALVPTLEDALASLRPEDPSTAARAVTFVTGPSRTADIEMTLVVGVHGPRELLVILLDPSAPSPGA